MIYLDYLRIVVISLFADANVQPLTFINLYSP